jgi:UDP-glucose 4-epimerase
MPQIAEIARELVPGAMIELVPGADDVPDVQTEFDVARIQRDLSWYARFTLREA